MTAKVSLVMPAYNAAGFIRRSVGSVLSQSYKNIELIVVDDGSKDNTAAVLSEIAAEDERLRPITVENGGPAMARNRGIEAASPDTDYFMFIDSDDELLPDAVEYALKGAESGAELVAFGFTIVSADGSKRDYCEPEKLISRSDFGKEFADLYKANLLNQVWGKLYSAELLRDGGVRFKDYRWGEDRLFIFDCLEKVEKLVHSAAEGEFSSRLIGEAVMDELKLLDEVAYVRFASVYRQFTDVSSFMDELNKLVLEGKARQGND